METKPCVFCGKPAPQVEGRKSRKFCSNTCRQKHWQAQNKTIPALKIEDAVLLVPNPDSGFIGIIPAIIESGYKPKDYHLTLERLAELSPPELPTRTFQEYLTIIKMTQYDPEQVLAEVRANKKLTGAQKSTLYSKLKS